MIWLALLAIATTQPSQIKFKADGANAVSRVLADRLADSFHVKNYGGCNETGLTQAIAALPAGGGTVDARSCTSFTVASSITISKAAVTVLFPAAQIDLGTNQLLVAAGTHNVALVGSGRYGSANLGTAIGTAFTYTGTGAALAIGDSSADTSGFGLDDISVIINAAGTAAVGIQLNRVINYEMTRPRVQGMIAANTQKLIDLEGYINYTGGVINQPYLSNGNSAIYFGKNANANMVFGAQIAMGGIGTGVIAYNMVGDPAGSASGNAFFGGDVENCQYVMKWDWATGTQALGMRSEQCTQAVNATANSIANTFWGAGATPNTETDLGSNNSILTTFTNIMSQNRWKLRNLQDVASDFVIQSGLTAEQYSYIHFTDKTGTNLWEINKDPTNNFNVTHTSTGINRYGASATNSNINSESSGSVNFNYATNSGTAGVGFGSGGASPAVVGSISGAGKANFSGLIPDGIGTKHKRATAGCTTAATLNATCTTTVTWGTAFADANYTAVCKGVGVTGLPILQAETAKLAASVTVQTINLTAVAAAFTTIECVAVHD